MDEPTENELLHRVVATAADRIGIPVRVTKNTSELDGQRVDAVVRIGRGKTGITYVVEVKRGLRPATLGPSLSWVGIGRRWTEFDQQEYGVVLGGEPAAEQLARYLRPETATVYGASQIRVSCLISDMWTDTRGPVEVLKRFWNFEGEDAVVAPLPLVYTDLLAIGDARCLETANLLHERIVDRFND